MTISVVVCTYNRCENLKSTLESLLHQETDGSFDHEVLVVDNNSSDRTQEVVESHQSSFGAGLKYLSEPRQGKPYALNKGIKETRGDIIALTDDDCIVDKKWIINICKVFKERDIDILGGKVIPLFSNPIPKWLLGYEKTMLRYPLMHFELGNNFLLEFDRMPIGANMCLKKSSFLTFGGYAAQQGRSEDIELCHRWKIGGGKIGYSPDVLVYHRTNPLRMTKKYFRRYFFQTGRDQACIFSVKYAKGRKIFKIPLWLFRELCVQSLSYAKTRLLGRKYFATELLILHKLGIMAHLADIKIDYRLLR